MSDTEDEEEESSQRICVTIRLRSNGHADSPWELLLKKSERASFRDVSHAGWQVGITAMYALLDFAKTYPFREAEFEKGMLEGIKDVVFDREAAAQDSKKENG